MAGESSKASYLNIETFETLCHPKIEPEINTAEGTRDFDEVCGLERKECDEIIEQLKNNPGLVVKSLGPEGRIVLHVTVMANETKKPKPSTSKCNNVGFSEAAHDSNWYHALGAKDCKALMSLLQANPCLMAQRGHEGWTILHATAQRGCLELLDQVFDLFKGTDQFVDEMSGVKVGLDDLLKAKCCSFEAEAQHMAWFTCSIQVYDGLTTGFRFRERFSSTQQSNSNAFQHLMDKLIEIMQRETSKKAFESLEEDYQSNNDYNFVLQHEKLQFHYACKRMWFDPTTKDYVKTIINGCLELGPFESVKVLTYLLQLHNAQGLTPFHVALKNDRECQLLELVPTGDAYKECLNAKDVRGWTILHYVATTPIYRSALEALLKDKRIDANARTSPREPLIWDGESVDVGMTALHLAILHNNAGSVKLLLQCPRTNVYTLFHRHIVCGYERIKLGNDLHSNCQERHWWLPLELAAIMGLSEVVRALLLKCGDIDDDEKLQNNMFLERKFQGTSALLLASASGNPDTLRLFLDHPKFNPLVTFEGATALHYATNATMPVVKDHCEPKVDRLIFFSDLGYLDRDPCRYKENLEDIKLTPISYLGRQACITMLLQAGIDI